TSGLRMIVRASAGLSGSPHGAEGVHHFYPLRGSFLAGRGSRAAAQADAGGSACWRPLARKILYVRAGWRAFVTRLRCGEIHAANLKQGTAARFVETTYCFRSGEVRHETRPSRSVVREWAAVVHSTEIADGAAQDADRLARRNCCS